jgi:hypothetical protein
VPDPEADEDEAAAPLPLDDALSPAEEFDDVLSWPFELALSEAEELS